MPLRASRRSYNADYKSQRARGAIGRNNAMSDIGMPRSWAGEPFIHHSRDAKPVIRLDDDYFPSNAPAAMYRVGD